MHVPTRSGVEQRASPMIDVTEAMSTNPARTSDGLFRLAVDRCFTLAGQGTAVTGTVLLMAGFPVLLILLTYGLFLLYAGLTGMSVAGVDPISGPFVWAGDALVHAWPRQTDRNGRRIPHQSAG